MSRSSGAGVVGDNEINTIGYKPGFDGYREAVECVYLVFGEDLDESTLNFQGTDPPNTHHA